MRRPIATIPVLIGGLAWGAAAAASTAFGTLGNFDTVNDTGQVTGSSRPAALAAAAFSAQAARTASLCGRMGQWPSRLLNSSQ